jgi:hypothetical protein
MGTFHFVNYKLTLSLYDFIKYEYKSIFANLVTFLDSTLFTRTNGLYLL